MTLLGSVRIASEVFEVWHDPDQEDSGSFQTATRRIVLRERNPKHAVHELFHALIWTHGLSDLIVEGGEEALCAAVEISWPDAQQRLDALFAEPEE